jgi:hypothetical protein
MAATQKAKFVDIVPHLTINDDFRKVSEYNGAEYNSIVRAIACILTMEQGTNQLYPNMGCREALLSLINIPQVHAHGVLDSIKDNISTYVSHEVFLNYKVDPRDSEMLYINIIIPGLPTATLQVGPKSRYVRIVDQHDFK